MQSEPWWEESFEDLETSTFGEASSEILVLNDMLAPDSDILDLGCGDGRNGLYLAERGHCVTFVDTSVRGIRKLRHRAAAMGLEIEAHVADMRDYDFGRPFDVIIAHGVLMLVTRPEWRQVVERMKHYTRPGGRNLVCVITDATPVPDNLKPFCIGVFHPGELQQVYADWHEDYWTLKRKVDNQLSYERILSLDKLISRKPAY